MPSIETIRAECETIRNTVIEFYEKHNGYINRAYELAKSFKNFDRLNPCVVCSPNEIPFNEDNKPILIITANENEKSIFLYYVSFYMSDLSIPHHLRITNLYKYQNQTNEFLVFCWFKYRIYYCPLPEYGDETTRRAIVDAKREFSRISSILLLGICYGMDHTKLQLGDVLVSECIRGYRVNFRDREGTYDKIDVQVKEKSYYRHSISTDLRDSIRHRISGMNFSCKLLRMSEEENSPSFIAQMGNIASADHIISCYPIKYKIINDLERGDDFIGGEMEATGIFKAFSAYSDENKPDWVVIKSICDWGVIKNFPLGTKIDPEILKNSLQAYAMMNTMELFVTLLDMSVWG